MALKPDRTYTQSDISVWVNTVAERGGIVCYDSTASGVAMDDSRHIGAYVANPSGANPVGILLQDVVDKDLTQTHLNFFKDEVIINSKAAILSQGEVVTNMIYPGQSPTPGQVAYVGHSGLISNISISTSVAIGRFATGKDENGFARVKINLP